MDARSVVERRRDMLGGRCCEYRARFAKGYERQDGNPVAEYTERHVVIVCQRPQQQLKLKGASWLTYSIDRREAHGCPAHLADEMSCTGRQYCKCGQAEVASSRSGVVLPCYDT